MQLKKINHITNIFEVALIFIGIFLAAVFMAGVNEIQGNAKVVNYAGFVRGSTQRLVKLELSHQPSDALISRLDALMESLKNGGGEFELRKISAPGFAASLQTQKTLWHSLKQEIYLARARQPENTNLLALSEDYFELADQTVREVQTYSDDKAASLKTIETALIINMAFVIMLLMYKTAAEIVLTKRNKELRKLAFYDAQTGLPNKGNCDSLLLQHRELSTAQNDACVMFDLNNLKTVNDSQGHKAGDFLILSFASIIRRTMPKDVFVGRYGGDEFIAVLFDTDETTVRRLLGNVEENVNCFNEAHKNISIRYAVGYQMSGGCEDCSLQMLLNKADQKMYADKAKKKRLQSA